MKTIFLVLLFFLIASTVCAKDVFLNSYENGAVITELTLQYKGHDKEKLLLFDPLDTVSPDGLFVVPIQQGKFLTLQGGVIYVLVPHIADSISVYRRDP